MQVSPAGDSTASATAATTTGVDTASTGLVAATAAAAGEVALAPLSSTFSLVLTMVTVRHDPSSSSTDTKA